MNRASSLASASSQMLPAEAIAQRLLPWFNQHGRTQLPWQQPNNPYAVWVSEIMLQQTQVNTVIPFYTRFMQHFPRVQDLAQADEDRVLALWSGLGYYARARHLHRAAKIVAQELQGHFPQDSTALQTLPGIGRSTAGAILSMAFGLPAPILDGNVKRVLTRLHAITGWTGATAVAQHLWQLATYYTPTHRVADYTQAIMDLGATVCTRTQPRCTHCPLHDICQAYQQGNTHVYPQAKVSKRLPIKAQYFLVLHNAQGEILLEKRPPHGIWGGLWCFPVCDMTDSIVTHCATTYGYAVQRQTAQPSFKHTFSHFHLEIYPLHLHVQALTSACKPARSCVWLAPQHALHYGLAAPTLKLLRQLGEQA